MDYWNEIKIRSTRTETILGMQQERSLCWAVELRLCLVFFKTGWNGVERGGLKKTEQGFWFGDWVRWVEILYLGSRSFRASRVNLFRCLQGCPSQGKETERNTVFIILNLWRLNLFKEGSLLIFFGQKIQRRVEDWAAAWFFYLAAASRSTRNSYKFNGKAAVFFFFLRKHGSCLLAISHERNSIAQTTHPLRPPPRTFL